VHFLSASLLERVPRCGGLPLSIDIDAHQDCSGVEVRLWELDDVVPVTEATYRASQRTRGTTASSALQQRHQRAGSQEATTDCNERSPYYTQCGADQNAWTH
jgi:hypothetical protein